MTKIMKFLRSAIGCIALMATFTACGSSTPEPEPQPNIPTRVTFSKTDLSFVATPAAAQSLSINANVETTVVSDASWCKLSGTTSGKAFTFNVECEPNTETSTRECNITAFSPTKEQTYASIKVTQEGCQPAPGEPVIRPENAASPLALGWNLGNQMDAHNKGVANETCWGNPKVDKKIFDAVAAAGFSSVRIPVSWMGHFGGAPDYKIETAWLDRVAELVGYAEQAGLKVIVNIHHDGAPANKDRDGYDNWLNIKKAATDQNFNAEVKATLSALWTQIANKFADKGDFLYFEAMNEIQDGGWGWGDNTKDGGKQYATLNEWMQVFVDAVRSAGGNNANRWLCIPTYSTNIDLGDHLVLPSDPANKLIVAVHCYEPYLYTLEDQYSEWGHTGSGTKRPNNGEKELVAEFDKIINKWISKGIPAYIGEFGCVHRTADRAEAFRKYYLEYYVKAAADRNIPVVYWDNGNLGTGRETGGLFDRKTGEYANNSADITAIFRKAWNTNDGAYTLQSVYDSAPK